MGSNRLDTTRSCPSATHHTTPGCFGRQCPSAPLLPLALSPPSSLLNGCTALRLPQQFHRLFQQAKPASVIADGHAADELAASAECRDGASAAGSDAASQDGRRGSHSAGRHAGTRHALQFKKFITPPACMPCACLPASSPASASLQRKHSMPTDVIPDCPRAVAQL